MKAPNPKESKARTSRHRGNVGALVRNVVKEWESDTRNRAVDVHWTTMANVVSDLSDRLPGPLAGDLQKVIASKDAKALLALGAVYNRPQMYDGSSGYLAATTVLSLLKKYPFEGVEGLDPLKVAKDRSREAEMLCRQTNQRFAHYRAFDFSARPLTKRLGVHQIFHLARRKIERWLGEVDEDLIFSLARFGPGGVVGLKRPFTTAYYKLSASRLTVSEGAYWPAVKTLLKSDAWLRTLCEEMCGPNADIQLKCVPFETLMRLIDRKAAITNYNEVTYVPKDAKTHRAIAIEPHLNVFLQLAVGTFLKQKLKNVGCDLTDQTRNQRLACLGSIYQDRDDPVTLDMSMASDCLSIELVRELLPPKWFELLDMLRSRYGRLDGCDVRWEKFSSMGNGFTFELESLIFYALSQACGDYLGVTERFIDTYGTAYAYPYTSVYGDDIIVPFCVADHLIQVLRFCGFKTNEDKSFTTGPFRESCGKDYFNGVLVRPFFLKRKVTRNADLIHLHNGLKRLDKELGLDLPKSLDFLRRTMPKALELHLRGCEPTVGDDYLWVSPDECHASGLVRWDPALQNWQLPRVVQKQKPQKGRACWRYCQFLYINCGNSPSTLESARESLSKVVTPSGGMDGGAIVLSGAGSPYIVWGSLLGDFDATGP